MNLADYTAHFLKLNGVKRVFGLPGGENLLFLEALRGAGLDFILFHHETAAGFAAGVTGQLTGIPGVCLSTVGPGAVNLVAAAAAASLERSPMLAITADIETSWQNRVRHMKVDLPRLFDGAAKGSFTLNPGSVGDDLTRAWNMALEPPMGAVHVAISPDMAEKPISKTPRMVEKPAPLEPDNEALHRARSLLERTDEIMILAGIGLEVANAQDALLRLAEQWQAPVAVTPKAKGHFPESHPLFAGCFSAYGDSPLREALTKADVILGVGLDSVDFVTSTWDIDTPMVNLNQSSDDDPAFDPVVTVNGDIQASLSYLAAHVDRAVSAPAMVTQKVSDLKQQIDQCMVFDGFTPREGSILVGDLINGLREALPDDGAVTIDVGVFKLVFLQQWHTDSPKSLFVANGLSAMGYAIPGALAVALEQPARKVAAVVGDGALLMYAGELATAARYRGSLMIIVIVDEALSLIRLKQLRLDIPIHGTEFQKVDYSALAESFDLEYRLIDGTRPSGAVFAEALAMNSPVLVEARVDRDEYDQFR